MYVPTVARFTARDPMPEAGIPVLIGHSYAYANNNPANWIDPSGLQVVDPFAEDDEGGKVVPEPLFDECKNAVLLITPAGTTVTLFEVPNQVTNDPNSCRHIRFQAEKIKVTKIDKRGLFCNGANPVVPLGAIGAGQTGLLFDNTECCAGHKVCCQTGEPVFEQERPGTFTLAIPSLNRPLCTFVLTIQADIDRRIDSGVCADAAIGCTPCE